MMFGMTWLGLGLLVFNATFNNISVITWWSVLLVEKTCTHLLMTDEVTFSYVCHNVIFWMQNNESFGNNLNLSQQRCLTKKTDIMDFNATFNNISVITWWSVLLVEKTTDLPQVTDKLYHIRLYQVHLAEAGFKHTLVVTSTDCYPLILIPNLSNLDC
jgi:hypothetical protein